MVNFNEVLAQLFSCKLDIIYFTIMVFWHFVSIAENESTFALRSQNSQFFLTVETSLFINWFRFSFLGLRLGQRGL